MHVLIAAIVEANDKIDALNQGKKIFDDLVDRSDFDYYATFDDPSAGQRWSRLPYAARLTSKEGKDLLEFILDATKNELFEKLKTIRKLLRDYDDEDIWYGDDIDCLPADKKVYRILKGGKRIDFENSVRFFRYCCYCIGAYSGPYVFLYDEDGDGIRDCTELKHFLEKKGEQKLWIVPADAHF
ncbi:MAG: hypothetical protein QW835_06920 [Candidatus Hadarchaeum sp.]